MPKQNNILFNILFQSAVFSAAFSYVGKAHAGSGFTESKPDHAFTVTILTAEGVDHNLKEIPGSIITADINWDSTYFFGLSIRKEFGSLGESIDALSENPLGRIVQGLELVAAKHHGLQDNFELGIAYKLRSPQWQWKGVATDIGFGIGLSHAFSDPLYEDGPFDDPETRYQTQLLILIDNRWRLTAYPRYSLLFRIHHRSGAYGAIAPQNVGSNFLALGLGYDF